MFLTTESSTKSAESLSVRWRNLSYFLIATQLAKFLIERRVAINNRRDRSLRTFLVPLETISPSFSSGGGLTRFARSPRVFVTGSIYEVRRSTSRIIHFACNYGNVVFRHFPWLRCSNFRRSPREQPSTGGTRIESQETIVKKKTKESGHVQGPPAFNDELFLYSRIK